MSGSHDFAKPDCPMTELNEADTVEDIFDSGLESLFGQHQAASGNPGQLCRISLQWDDEAHNGECGDQSRLSFCIPPNSVNKLQAHYQWDAGAFVARLIYNSSTSSEDSYEEKSSFKRLEANVRGLDVIELGAGTGLPGIVSARQGANSVVITDYPDPSLLEAIRGNVDLSLKGEVGKLHHGSCRVTGLDWSDPQGATAILDTRCQGFDCIIAADVLWLSSMHEALLDTICKLLANNDEAKDPRVLVVSGFHTGRRALARFFAMAERRGLIAAQESDVFEYDVVRKQSRPWSSTVVPFPQSSTPADSTTVDYNVAEDDDEYDNMDDHVERSRWLLYACLRRAEAC